jgi:hypothetical protein
MNLQTYQRLRTACIRVHPPTSACIHAQRPPKFTIRSAANKPSNAHIHPRGGRRGASIDMIRNKNLTDNVILTFTSEPSSFARATTYPTTVHSRTEFSSAKHALIVCAPNSSNVTNGLTVQNAESCADPLSMPRRSRTVQSPEIGRRSTRNRCKSMHTRTKTKSPLPFFPFSFYPVLPGKRRLYS